MRKVLAAALTAGALVAMPVASAEASTWSGKIYSTTYNSSYLNSYGIKLTTNTSTWRWMYPTTRVYGCMDSGVGNGSTISLSLLSRLKADNQTVRLDTGTVPYQSIYCI